jgi:dinuclear metal center YbgI/SA1388 family protein
MTCGEVFKYIENWAPREIAWNRDNVGLQVGSTKRVIKNILLSLDVNTNVAEEAIKKNCNLIITHHPLLFNPLRKIDTDNDSTSLLVEKLIKNNITLFSSHTNLDFTKDGVSFELAKTLKLQNIRFLSNLEANQYKLIIFVPEKNIDSVAQAIFENGGGVIGEYTHCSFRTKGRGTFKGSEKTNPTTGKKLQYEKVNEIKIEIIVDSWKLDKVMEAVRKVHPYEEIAYDIYPLKNKNINFGVGAIGAIKEPMTQETFLNYVSKSLNIKNFRYTTGKRNKIKKVAVCGGSGSEFVPAAIKEGTDAYISADIKYHTFFDYHRKILLIDAGHYETEVFSLNELKSRLTDLIKDNGKIKVYKYNRTTNPVIFYNNVGANQIDKQIENPLRIATD